MIEGIRVGHATDPVGLTGVTVVLSDRPAIAGIALRGGANDVVGLDHLDTGHLVGTVNGVVLGGGSRYGEEAVYGVMRWLEERGVGFRVGDSVIPHVPGAFLFDLNVGDAHARPTREMGYDAAKSAAAGPVAEGSVGAATGATVGKVNGIACAMRGGIGYATAQAGEVVVTALMAVNAVGDVRDPETGVVIAGTREAPSSRRLIDSARAIAAGAGRFEGPRHTTIGVVTTNARLTKTDATKAASLAIVGFGRALSPPHTAYDGDSLFVLSVGDTAVDLTRLGVLAAEAVARAIARGVRAAAPLPHIPAARDLAAT